jgi:hypothetical protein
MRRIEQAGAVPDIEAKEGRINEYGQLTARFKKVTKGIRDLAL